MSFSTFLFALLIEPLELVFEVIYVIAQRIIGNPGLSIIALSLAMNFLVLPLYRRADALQAEEQELEKRLNPSIAHIKKTFKGEEKFLMLQEFYRQNDYKPTYALRGSLSLLLEVPFFIAAYRFLSELELIKGVSFGPIKDLGAEDALIVIGGLTINLLPVLMTLINIISGAIYTKGMPLKSKIQLNAMALIFLFFLYKSPAGLVFYWTLNNVFSLVKNIFYKLKNPAYVLKWLAALCGAALVVVFAFVYPSEFLKRRVFFIAGGIVLMAPLVLHYIFGKKEKTAVNEKESVDVGKKSYTGRLFFVSVAALALITGVVIPGSVIKSSPSEFVEVSDFKTPLLYILKSATLSFGLFIIWIGIFYKLASPKGRKVFAFVASAFAISSVFNYMVYGKAKSNISSLLQYDNEPVFSISKQVFNFTVVILIFVLAYFALKKFEIQYVNLNTVIMLAFLVMSIVYIINIAHTFSRLTYIKDQSERIRSSDDKSIINLSKDGKNVIVIMMDRAVGSYVPFIMEEKPELKQSFDGFTFYHNTIAYGRTTNFGSPVLYGGYEYTPKEMNKRNKEKLVKKHNEALKIMPVTFLNNDYNVTVCEPPLAGYEWIPDLSVYKDYPEIKTYLTNKRLNVFAGDNANEAFENIRMRNFFCLGVTKIAPLVLQETLYNGGKYNEAHEESGSVMNPVQVRESVSKSSGIDAEFMNAYSVLDHLNELTGIRDDSENYFNMYCNEMTHQPVLLQKPDYKPSQFVDNTEFDEDIENSYVVDGIHMHMDTIDQVAHYQSNMAGMLLLGKWLDFLKEQGVYDNTKIIIVSDHGRDLYQFDELILEDREDAQQFAAVLMVKDFNAKGYNQSEEFMTNGDVPSIAFDGLIENPVNPFTGKEINSDAKTNEAPEVLLSRAYNIHRNNGKKFQPGKWYAVNGELYDKTKWEYLGRR